LAAAEGLRIVYVIETHLHADFVGGHRELAERAGAQVVFGRRAGATLAHRAVDDGDELPVGSLRLQIVETPGHTPEGISILVRDTTAPQAPAKLLTGDTLFIGDVGRPDLAGSKGFTAEAMAGMLYDSLHGKLLKLPDSTEVYPAHGAGSLCGRNMSTETMSTIGVQRANNYALAPMSKAAFVAMMTDGLSKAPAYFPRDAEINRDGAPALAGLVRPVSLAPDQFDARMREGFVALDVRPSERYGPRHIPGSLNIGLDGQFASWAGALIPLETPIVIVADDEAGVDEATLRLARVGFASATGYLTGGIDAWAAEGRPTAAIPQISIDEFVARLGDGEACQVIDVRRPPEFQAGHAAGAVSIPLAELTQAVAHLDRQRPTIVV
ncbi:MAG: MBL fold metallo-hydrolase, partial [Vulcanimicrobiaceae bacterium]